MSAAEIRIFGIRHHGPGSARSLCAAFADWRPDCVLVEGPPDADAAIPLAGHADMRPPVALLVYARDDPRQAAFYPFAEFSPEWQALRYALDAGAAVRFMDLPQRHQLQAQTTDNAEDELALQPDLQLPTSPDAAEPRALELDPIRLDPLLALAQAAGYADSERWWEQQVETRGDSTDLFAAILEAMTALRQELALPESLREQRREASMRQAIRQAQKAGHARIAVVCGAWHTPALTTLPPAAHDARLLKGLPTCKTEATWVPWTDERLSAASGYGAGIHSPGWYAHLWRHRDEIATRWLARVAQLLRAADIDASPAHVIEATRLAETLAAVRDRPRPGLDEMNEATLAIFCAGNAEPLRLIERQLIVGDRLGDVPSDAPGTPLQRDIEATQRRLRLKPAAATKAMDLDLRKPNDLARSHFLHRLQLLDIPWGSVEESYGKAGSFHEFWSLTWRPEFAIAIIEAGTWGNSVAAAADARVLHNARAATDLATLTALLGQVLLADLPAAMPGLMVQLGSHSALAADVTDLMAAVPALADILRYGNVRQTDTDMVRHYLDGLLTRICIGLAPACASLNDDAARVMVTHLNHVQAAVAQLADERHREDWLAALQRLVDQHGGHGLVQSRSLRILLDAKAIDDTEAARRLGLELSLAVAPQQAAAWVEGFLQGSGMLLMYDDRLFHTVDTWLTGLRPDDFDALLPLLRRTFGAMPAGERRQIGDRARIGNAPPSPADTPTLDPTRAARILPALHALLG